MDRIADSADFLKECGECFQESHSLRLKHSFAQLFIELLAPIAEVRACAERKLPDAGELAG